MRIELLTVERIPLAKPLVRAVFVKSHWATRRPISRVY